MVEYDDDDLFFDDDDPPARSKSDKKIPFLLTTGGICLLVLVVGGTISYFAFQKLSGPRSSVDLPQRISGQFALDAADYNTSLINYQRGPGDDKRLLNFVRQALDDSLDGEDIPLNTKLFIESVGKSQFFGKSRLGFVDRISLRNWLDVATPLPSGPTEHYRILRIRPGRGAQLATADIFLYSDEGQAVSLQWFLAQEDGAWSIYDYQRMEFGRRTSDEYASYLVAATTLASAGGYDKVHERLAIADAHISEGEYEKAAAILRQCENTPMLIEDREVGMLYIAYTWMSMAKYQQALRVLNRIKTSDMWGVWPSIAICHQSLGQYDQAVHACRQAVKQSPNHPNVHTILANNYENTDRSDRAADESIKGLQLSPNDIDHLTRLTQSHRVKDVPVILKALRESGDDASWRRLIYSSKHEWGEALLAESRKANDVPSVVVELLAANIAVANEDFDLAATHHLKAMEVSTSDYWKEAAKYEYESWRIENDSYEELFAESDDLEATVNMLLQLILYDDFYGDTEKLLAAIRSDAQVARVPATKFLSGLCHYWNDDHEAALVDIEKWAEWTKDNPDALNDADWLIGAEDEYVVYCLLQLNRLEDAVQRYRENSIAQTQITNHVLDTNPGMTRQYLDATEGFDSAEVGRLRVMANDAFRNGKAKECDELHQQALTLVAQGDSQQYLLYGMVNRRASDLVWNRSSAEPLRLNVDSGSVDPRQRHLLGGVNEAARLLDAELVDEWIQLAANSRVAEDGGTFNTMQVTRSNMLESLGETEEAIRTKRVLLSRKDKLADWQYQQCRSGLISLLLRSNQSNEAAKLISNGGDQDVFNRNVSSVPPLSVLYLATGDSVQLLKQLRSAKHKDVLNWLQGDEQSYWLNQHADQPWVDSLLDEYPLFVSTGSEATTGQLYCPATAKLDAESFARILKHTFDQPFVIEKFSTETRIQSAFLATGPDGQRIRFAITEEQYQHEAAPPAIKSQLSAAVVVVNISVLDGQANAVERLFRLASKVSTECDGFAFHWIDIYTRVWAGTNLSEQLEWDGRVPVSTGMPVFTFLPAETKSDEADGDQDVLTIQDWKKKLNEGDPIPVRFTVGFEALSGEIVSADPKKYSLQILSKSDSVVSPLIRKGKIYRCGVYSVHLLDAR